MDGDDNFMTVLVTCNGNDDDDNDCLMMMAKGNGVVDSGDEE